MSRFREDQFYTRACLDEIGAKLYYSIESIASGVNFRENAEACAFSCGSYLGLTTINHNCEPNAIFWFGGLMLLPGTFFQTNM